MCFLRVLNDAMAKKWQKRHEKWAKDNDITVPYLQIIYLNHEESRLHNIFPYVTLKVELARGSFGKRFPRAKAVISSRREEEACLTCLSIMYLKNGCIWSLGIRSPMLRSGLGLALLPPWQIRSCKFKPKYWEDEPCLWWGNSILLLNVSAPKHHWTIEDIKKWHTGAHQHLNPEACWKVPSHRSRKVFNGNLGLKTRSLTHSQVFTSFASAAAITEVQNSSSLWGSPCIGCTLTAFRKPLLSGNLN